MPTPAGPRLVLATVDGTEPFSPSFSADGRTLYFHTGRANGHLMQADLGGDGSVVKVEPVLSDAASNFHVVPSPAGSAVAFDSDRDGVRGVYTADPDGGRVRRISGAGFAAVPTWSPDGLRVAFVKADGNSRTWNVWVADVSTGALHQVSHHRTGQAWGASWFPDGRRLAYSREDELVIADLATGRRTTFRSPRPGHLVRTPSVAPDGTRIVFQVHGDGVWLLDLPRARFSRVLTDRSAEEFHWSPDGRRIVYHARSGRRWGVWTLGAAS
jgi:dipeptidyl aminopeptidase/acylaminoacyl peptidase